MAQTKLREALALLREEGWVKGYLIRPGIGRCSLGALGAVHEVKCNLPTSSVISELMRSPESSRDLMTLGRVMGELFPNRVIDGIAGNRVLVFNDDEAEWSEIEQAFEKAAIRREEQV